MTLDEAREEIISGIDYAAYRETDTSLHDADKNRLFGSEHWNGRRANGPDECPSHLLPVEMHIETQEQERHGDH